MFNIAKKYPEETYAQFAHRLTVDLNYYMKARKIDDSYDRLLNLLLADKLKTTLNYYLREQVRIVESGTWRDADSLAETLDIYVSERSDFTKVPMNRQYQ